MASGIAGRLSTRAGPSRLLCAPSGTRPARLSTARAAGVWRVPGKNGEVDPTIFPAVSYMQLGT